MGEISDTIAWLRAAAVGTTSSAGEGGRGLLPLEDFGTNPGALRAYMHCPDGLDDEVPLVVVLHGCSQSAAGYDYASGWSQAADEHGFVLLYPEQQRSNNPNGCFNWFEAADTQRGQGEALSIRQMITTIQARQVIDPSRIFITGLSAGGAMAATMLATYPEVFAGGAIIAGLPHGVAKGMIPAFDRMRAHGLPSREDLQAILATASPHTGPWPTVSVWHGDADKTVSVKNADAILSQWKGVHRVADKPSIVKTHDGLTHRIWQENGRTCLEVYIVHGMGHGTPIKGAGECAYGHAAPYMLDVGFSSTAQMVRAWGFTSHRERAGGEVRETLPKSMAQRKSSGPSGHPVPARTSTTGDVGKAIENALRAAGLMK